MGRRSLARLVLALGILAAGTLMPVAAFDPEAASAGYLSRLSPEEQARSDAYFEGGYWLQLWGLLYGLAVAGVLLGTGLSSRMRGLAERITRYRFLQVPLYWAQYLVVSTLLFFPLTFYRDHVREHRYGLSNHSFSGWLGDEFKGLLVGLVLGGLMLPVLYAVIRRAPRTWWAWGAGVAVVFLALSMVIGPVFLAPIFNTYTEVQEPEVREAVLRLARANGIPATAVWQSDASRQTTRISANVSGFLGTERITLNDNLLARCSQEEIEAVMAHEIGHYVLNHTWEALVFFGLVAAGGFGFVAWGSRRAIAWRGARWGVRSVEDPAGLPLLLALLAIWFFLLTPATNSFVRTIEAEADLFGLNAARQPDGFAEVALKLAEYRKLAPGRVEEWVFFDHPSGRSRILMAMRWKAENPQPAE